MSNGQNGKRERLILIDGFGLVFRAYHAVPPTLKTTRGEFTNATFGFTSMVLEVLRRDAPDYVVMTFDKGRNFRQDEDASYKANRGEMPDDLRSQLGRIREVVEALGMTIYELEGFEADDVIGTLAKQAEQMNLETLIITGDNDLLQLVNEHVTAVMPGSGPYGRFSDPRYFDTAKVIEKYGFEPKFVPDYKSIVGDKSDNIPNIPGLGAKTATNLITQYGHLEDILARVDEVKPPKVQESLKSYREQAVKSKYMATIVIDIADIKLDLQAARAHQIDRNKIVDIFRQLEFNSLMNKLPGAPATPANHAPVSAKTGEQQMRMFDVDREPDTNHQASASQTQTPDAQNYHLVTDQEKLVTMVARIQETRRFSFDTETTSTNPLKAALVGLSLSPAIGEAYYIPVGHEQDGQLEWEVVRKIISPIFSDLSFEVVAHHANYDMAVLHRHGIELQKIPLRFDTMIAAQALGLNSPGLKELALNRLGIEMTHIEELIGKGKSQLTMDKVAMEKAMPYACADADMTLRLVENLTPQLKADGQWQLLTEIEMPLTPVLTTMELCGIALDSTRMGEVSTLLYQKMKELEIQIFEWSGHPFNINSTDQLGKVLYEELGLQSGKKTSTKKFSTDKKTLDNLREAHPIVNAVLEWRQVNKLKSTYADSLPLLVNPETGRVHTSFHQIGASSGRISSSDPNLQNIPIRSEIGREVRRAFVADNRSPHRLFKEEDSVLFAADYSQIELRLLAHLTGDTRLTEAFLADKDVHRATAAIVFGVSEDEVTSDMRRVAKTVNFGIIYGLSAFGLSQQIALSVVESKKFIDTYNQTYPAIKAYLDKTPDEARTIGYVQTLFGRRRYMPELNASNAVIRNEAERAAINMPVQGTAADIVKIAMRRVYNNMRELGLRAKLLLQVHDELVFETPRSELPVLAELAKRNMESVGRDIDLKVPLKADLRIGPNWGDMDEYKF